MNKIDNEIKILKYELTKLEEQREKDLERKALRIDELFGIRHKPDEDCDCYKCIKARTEMEEILDD